MATWPSIPGTPPTMAAVLDNLANQNKLSGVTPAWLESIAQGESGFEVKGAGVNSSGYGGYFGLHYGTGTPKGVYSSGSASRATLLSNTPAALTHQAEIVAGDLASVYAGTPGATTARQGFQGDTRYVNQNITAVRQGLSVKATGATYPQTGGTAGGAGTTSSPLTPGGFSLGLIGKGKTAVETGIKFATDPLGFLVSKESGYLIRGALILVGLILVLIGFSKIFSGNSDTNPVTTVVEGSQKTAHKAKETAKDASQRGGEAAAVAA